MLNIPFDRTVIASLRGGARAQENTLVVIDQRKKYSMYLNAEG
jgi:hypothetical protein